MIIKSIDRFCTNIDAPDSPENIAVELRGLIPRRSGSICERDFGTINRYAVPPIRPNAFKVVSGAANNGSGLIRLTVTGHGYATSDVVYVDEVGGTVEAKGKWTITKINNDTFDLQGSTFTNAYTSGGIASKTPITIINGYTFTDTNETEYDIVVGLDSSSNMRIYVYDGGWIELTRKIDALINDAPGASDATFDIDTITENAVAYVPTADELNNWIVVNTTRNNQTILITDCTATNLTVDTVIGSNGLNWQNNDVLEIYRFPTIKFNYTFSNGATPLLRWMAIQDQRKVNLLYSHTDGTIRQGIQIMRRNERNYFHNGTSYLRTLPAGWYVESDFGIINPFYVNEGSIEFPTTTAKTALSVSNATNASPIVITTSSAHGLSNGNYVKIKNVLGNLAANGIFQIANVTSNTLELVGSSGSGAYSASVDSLCIFTNKSEIYDKTSNRNWMSIAPSNNTTGVATRNSAIRIFVTVRMSDYQESDPIFAGYYYHSSCSIDLSVRISFALMNKEFTEINLYAATANSTVYSAGWSEAQDEYYLMNLYSMKVQTVNTGYFGSAFLFASHGALQDNSKPYFGYYSGGSGYDSSSIDYAIAGASVTMFDQLNHDADKTREYPTSRYAVKVARPQGAVSVIDEDDITLRVSNRNGDNINEDDNYPNRTIDNDAAKLKVFLNSSGELMGLAVHNDQINAFKRNEREYADLQSGLQGIKSCDFVAPDSLVKSPHGLSWAGDRGIYLLPEGYESEVVLNVDWQNLYDGTLKITQASTTAFVTSAARRAIKSHYSSAQNALFFQILLNKPTGGTEYVTFVYSFNAKPLTGSLIGWYQRKFNIGSDGAIQYFSYRESDDSLTIAHSYGILKYPNASGSYLYQDDVLINGASTQISQNKGIPTKLKLMLGSFYGLFSKANYDRIKIDYSGESISGTGYFNILFWLNKMSSAFETKTQSIDNVMDTRKFPPIGGAERMAIEINFTEDEEEDFKRFDISTIELTASEDVIKGNR